MAYLYIYSVKKPLKGSFANTNMSYSYNDSKPYISLGKSSSVAYEKVIDGSTYTFNSTRYGTYNYTVSDFFTKKVCITFSGFGLTLKQDVYNLFKNTPVYYSNTTIDSDSVYEVDIVTNVTFNTNNYYYEIELDFAKISDEVKSLMVSNNSLRFYYPVGLTSSISTTYSVTTNLKNFKTHEIPTFIEKNSNFNYLIESLDDYYIKTLNSNIGNVTISSDKLQGTISGVATNDITISGVSEKIYEVEILGELINCTCNFTNGEIIDISKKSQIIIKAKDGYTFNGNYEYRQNYVTMSFDVNDDNTILTAEIYANCEYSLFDTYKATKSGQKISSFTHSYIVTDSILKKLSKARFYNDIDYGQYITSLYILPLNISDFVGDGENIILGNYDTDIECDTVSQFLIDFDFGTIDIKGSFGNVYDYKNCNCYVNIPFIEEFTMSIDDIMDSTIRIDGVLDIYTGILTVNLYSNKFNSNIYSTSRKIGFDIPFIQNNGSIVNSYSNNNVNPINKAFIDIRFNTPYNKSNNIKEVVIFDKIENHINEFIKCDNILINNDIPYDDYTNIVDLLKEGVIINE
jgi:hypothetical protein